MTYTTVAIPKTLIGVIDEKIVGKQGYRNRSEFIIEAIRRRLDEMDVK